MFRKTDGPVGILDEIAADEITVRGTLYAGGGAALFQKRVLLGLMQDSSVYSPFYWEDVEWGVRAWRRGYRSLYYPTSKAWHGHRTTNRMFFPECEIGITSVQEVVMTHLRKLMLEELERSIASATSWARQGLPALSARSAHLRRVGLPTSGKRARFPRQSTYLPVTVAFQPPWRQRL
jgi:hypothetical protein